MDTETRSGERTLSRVSGESACWVFDRFAGSSELGRLMWVFAAEAVQRWIKKVSTKVGRTAGKAEERKHTLRSGTLR